MTSSLSAKLTSLAARAQVLQLETGATSVTLDHLAAGRRTVRETLSLVLTASHNGEPMFILHREKAPQKDASAAPQYRAAVFGGGVESIEEMQFRQRVQIEPETVDQRLLEAGKVPPDLWYRLQGKSLLATGELVQLTYPLTSDFVESFVRNEIAKRLLMEAGEAAAFIQDARLLQAEFVETAVLGAKFGSFTDAITQAHGLTQDASGRIAGIGILVRERFAAAGLVTSPMDFAAHANGSALVWSADQLIANAERDTNDAGTWKGRMAHQGVDNELPIRNHSLLMAAAEAVRS